MPIPAVVASNIEAIRCLLMRVCSCRRVTTREKLLPGPVLLGPLPRSLAAQVLHPTHLTLWGFVTE